MYVCMYICMNVFIYVSQYIYFFANVINRYDLAAVSFVFHELPQLASDNIIGYVR